MDLPGRRNKIIKATKEVWSGNDVPKFRGNLEEMKKLDKLVSDLLTICSCKYFGHMLYENMFWTVYRNDEGKSRMVMITKKKKKVGKLTNINTFYLYKTYKHCLHCSRCCKTVCKLLTAWSG